MSPLQSFLELTLQPLLEVGVGVVAHPGTGW